MEYLLNVLMLNISNVYSIDNAEKIEDDFLYIESLSASIKQKRTSKNIVNKLKKRHYKKYIFDDDLSSDLFDKYL